MSMQEVLILKLKEGTGLTAFDDSPKANNAALLKSDGVLPAWIAGGGVDLDGIGAYMEVADNPSLTFGDGTTDKPFSVAVLIKADDITGFCLAGKGLYNIDAEWRLTVFTDDKVRFQTYDESVDNCVIGRKFDTVLTDYEGTLLLITGTYDGSGTSAGFKIYLGGRRVDDTVVQDNPGSYVAMENTLNHAVWIGRDAANYGDGQVLWSKIFAKELTPVEVRSLSEGISPIIGVEWNQNTDTWRHINIKGTTITTSVQDFNRHPIWGGMRRCNMEPNGHINAYWGEPGYEHDGTNGRVMVEVPRFYVFTARPGANIYRWWISDRNLPQFYIHPWFKQGKGVPVTHRYMAAYEADGYDDGGTFKLHSRSGKQPVTGGTGEPYPDLPADHLDIAEARQYAENVGTDWVQMSIWGVAAIRLLYYVEYADANSQTTIGRGVVDKPSGEGFAGDLTGADSIDTQLENSNGTGSGTGANGYTPIAYRWIENLWGNVWKFVDGYNAIDAEYQVLNKAGTNVPKDDMDADGQVPLSSTTAPLTDGGNGDSDGYISNILWDAGFELLLIGSATGGTVSSYLYDYFYIHDITEVNILLFGGFWYYGSIAGVASLSSFTVASSSDRHVGARLEYKGFMK
ncbi:hypothetical protein D4R42_03765 [bacterium]|nr:MAG: hypothetical protein D4R42_03765 [bacterium]